MAKKRKTAKKSAKTAGKQKKPKTAEVLPPEEMRSDSSEDENEVIDVEGPLLVPSEPKDLDVSAPALSPQDPLARYLEEIRRYPLLTPEEEFALAKKMKETGDVRAAQALISANLRLVVKIAMEYRNVYTNAMDLIQEGNVGLMKGVSKYDPDRGVRLMSYANLWIRSYILKFILDNFRLVKIGTTQAQKKLFYHLMREKEKLEAQGLVAAPKLLAEKLDVKEKEVVEMQQRLSGQGAEMSIDTPLGGSDEGESRTTHGDMIVDDHENADDTLARQQMVDILRAKLPEFELQLNEKEKQVLQERLLSEVPKTLQGIADDYGLTRERARQIEAQVIKKLRSFLESDLK